MAAQDLSEEHRAAVDRSRTAARGGSIGLVLLVALALVGAAVGLLLVGRGNSGPYILMLLAFLSMVGVFCLFALATGILRVAGREADNPVLKAMVATCWRADPENARLCQIRSTLYLKEILISPGLLTDLEGRADAHRLSDPTPLAFSAEGELVTRV